jgi:hypothetical protein
MNNNIIPLKPGQKPGAPVKFCGEISAEDAELVRKFIMFNKNRFQSSHGPMTAEKLVTLLLQDVAASIRDGDTWQGCQMALVLTQHGYWTGADYE